MPILGMQKYFDSAVGQDPAVTHVVSPGARARSTTHGGFDDDEATMKSVIAYIKGRA